MNPLAFRCTGCGNCCRTLRVAITGSDVARLAAATGKAPNELVDWLAPDAVNMTGEPGSFVELSEGRRLMVLGHTGGACALLDTADRCSAYTARPLDCRAFPFDFERASTGRPRLKLLPLADCEHARDGAHTAGELGRVDAQRWHELARYQDVVGQWNRLVKRRRRFGLRAGSGADFLAFVLTSTEATRPRLTLTRR
jgi:Fe-S-cluster containining protein